MSLPSINSELHELRELESVITETFQHCDKLKTDIITYSSDPKTEMSSLKDHMFMLAEMQTQVIGLSSAADKMESLVNNYLENNEETSSRTLVRQFESALQSSLEDQFVDVDMQKILTSVENYLSADQNRGHDETDDDLLITDATESYKDPLTKQTMVDPVKSKVCNHSYERSSILQFLQEPKKCPYSGCPSLLKRCDLMDDVDLKSKLANLRDAGHS